MKWSELNHLQIGRYAEYLVKMEFAKHPDLSVFTIEVDDRGIDFLLRHKSGSKIKYFEVQVKSFRKEKTSYVFIADEGVLNPENSFVALVMFEDGNDPNIYLIPIQAWEKPSNLLKQWTVKDISRRTKKPRFPEYGIRLSKKNLSELEQFKFSGQIDLLTQ
ncbi:MAG: DUF4365 domain-containing protein [Bacteroidetes bacterium]|nr:DUF4365 domain-containing protein [Bacteroidota bacterium]